MSRYTADVRYIASIYPGNLQAQILHHGPSTDPRNGRATRYWIPPVPKKEKPEIPEYVTNVKAVKVECPNIGVRWCAVLEVSDSFENVPDVSSIANGGKMQWTLAPVDCDQIATYLWNYWAGHFVGLPVGAAPGIMIVSGEVPKIDEMLKMIHMQQAFYEHRLLQGDKCQREGNWKEFTEEMRDAARYLGKTRDWAGGVISGDCFACKQPIPPDAYICHHCGYQIKPLPVAPAVAAAVAAQQNVEDLSNQSAM